jgi:hypothetical protein
MVANEFSGVPCVSCLLPVINFIACSSTAFLLTARLL